MKQLSVNPAIARKVLEKTKVVCQEAFRLISSEDARREGFFRKAGPLTESFPHLRQVPKIAEMTGDGVSIIDTGHSLCMFNSHFSVNASMTYIERWDNEIELFLAPIYLEGIIANGEIVKGFRFELTYEDMQLGILLRGQFDAREIPMQEFIRKQEDDKPKGKSLIDYDRVNKSGSTLISEIYARILRLYPENNYEIARIALNLLAEFEAMLNSAIRHFEKEGAAQTEKLKTRCREAQ